MGGGNGQKSKMARERNSEKNKGPKGSQLESNKKAMTIQASAIFIPYQVIGLALFLLRRWSKFSRMKCKICMQTFMCTTSEVKCREHAEAKHPKSDVYQCFPHLK